MKTEPKNIVFEGKAYISTKRLAKILHVWPGGLKSSAYKGYSQFGRPVRVDAVVVPVEEKDRQLSYISVTDASKLLKTLTEQGPGDYRPEEYPAYKVARIRRRLLKEERDTLAGVNVGSAEGASRVPRINYRFCEALRHADLPEADRVQLWEQFVNKDRISPKDRKFLREKGLDI